MKFIEHRLKTRYLASTDAALFQYAEFQTQFRIERSILTGLRGYGGMGAVYYQQMFAGSMRSNIRRQTWKIKGKFFHFWCFDIKIDGKQSVIYT